MSEVPRKILNRFACTLIAMHSIMLIAPCVARAASRPKAPDGYEVAPESGAWVFRPTGGADSELAIHVLGPFVSAKSPEAFLLEWLASRPRHDDYSTPSTRADLSVTTRETHIGEHKYIEAISAIRSEHGEYFIEQVLVPIDRANLRNSLQQANGEIAGAISRGEISSPPPGAGNARQIATPPVRALPADRASRPAEPPLRVGTARSVASQNVGAIDSVSFDSVTHMGYGGYMTFDPTPMVLFKSGEAVADMTALNAPEGLAAHRATHPDEWMHWRRDGKVIEVDRKGQWKKLYYTKTLKFASAGYRLEGDYQRLSGGGNIAVVGPTSMVLTRSAAICSRCAT
jgi:hypothetical protein